MVRSYTTKKKEESKKKKKCWNFGVSFTLVPTHSVTADGESDSVSDATALEQNVKRVSAPC